MSLLMTTPFRIASAYFPNTDPHIARKQWVKLQRAKRYMAERGICAAARGSVFQYERSTGSVLGK